MIRVHAGTDVFTMMTHMNHLQTEYGPSKEEEKRLKFRLVMWIQPGIRAVPCSGNLKAKSQVVDSNSSHEPRKTWLKSKSWTEPYHACLHNHSCAGKDSTLLLLQSLHYLWGERSLSTVSHAGKSGFLQYFLSSSREALVCISPCSLYSSSVSSLVLFRVLLRKSPKNDSSQQICLGTGK